MAILLTGLPSGVVSGFQNYTGATQADMLRLNMAIAPATTPNIYGILGGDLAGFPNGRRVMDDVFAIELRALAGATYPLVMPSYTRRRGRVGGHRRPDPGQRHSTLSFDASPIWVCPTMAIAIR